MPIKAVELVTGVHDPIVRGFFDLNIASGIGAGTCTIYQSTGEKSKVLLVDLTPGGYQELVGGQISAGASPLPEIVPGAIGYYFRPPDGKYNRANALLVRGKAMLSVQLDVGVAGRDNAADVVALMKLIAPKLITDASAPSPGPSGEGASPSPVKTEG
ncbi:hypothetical protein AB0M95_38960 [Sphaerisporangium sp. NPDC051017]|uniref:hypothetical protein n=1 Tax=Sphaerisporangium sp. NPDC051017 TaxID=3154636 RepID=UPI00341CA1BD